MRKRQREALIFLIAGRVYFHRGGPQKVWKYVAEPTKRRFGYLGRLNMNTDVCPREIRIGGR